jgi:hypothetical protein
MTELKPVKPFLYHAKNLVVNNKKPNKPSRQEWVLCRPAKVKVEWFSVRLATLAGAARVLKAPHRSKDAPVFYSTFSPPFFRR